MPNWCINEWTVTGDADKIEAFLREIQSDDGWACIDFNKIVPMPELIENTSSGWSSFEVDGKKQSFTSWYSDGKTERPFNDGELKGLAVIGAMNWHEWANKYWGCKWNASETKLAERWNNIIIYFQTPWEPPRPIEELVQDRYPHLEFQFEHMDETEQSTPWSRYYEADNLNLEELMEIL